jgi:hypothetical protein
LSDRRARTVRIPACVTIGKARRALLRGVVHVRHALAEVEGPELKAEVERVRGEIHTLRDRLSSLSTRIRRQVKAGRLGVARA